MRIFSTLAHLLSAVILTLINFPWVRSLSRYLARIFNPAKDILIKVHDYRMYANSIDRLAALLLWKYSALEDAEAIFMSQLIKNGATVVDVGANIGFHTIHFSRLAGDTGRVFAFEPEQNNFRLLVKNLGENQCGNVTPLQKAVADRSGTLQLFICEEHQGDHRIFDSHDGRDSIKIETVALDEFFSTNPKVDFIKMDIQGAEYLALQGMKNIIKQNKGIAILCEFSPDLLTKANATPARFIDELNELGLMIYLIDPRKGHISPIGKEALLRKYKGHRYVNLYLTREPNLSGR